MIPFDSAEVEYQLYSNQQIKSILDQIQVNISWLVLYVGETGATRNGNRTLIN